MSNSHSQAKHQAPAILWRKLSAGLGAWSRRRTHHPCSFMRRINLQPPRWSSEYHKEKSHPRKVVVIHTDTHLTLLLSTYSVIYLLPPIRLLLNASSRHPPRSFKPDLGPTLTQRKPTRRPFTCPWGDVRFIIWFSALLLSQRADCSSRAWSQDPSQQSFVVNGKISPHVNISIKGGGNTEHEGLFLSYIVFLLSRILRSVKLRHQSSSICAQQSYYPHQVIQPSFYFTLLAVALVRAHLSRPQNLLWRLHRRLVHHTAPTPPNGHIRTPNLVTGEPLWMCVCVCVFVSFHVQPR